MSAFDNPLVVGIILAVVSSAVGYLGYRRAKKADKVAVETGTIGSVYAGLDAIIKALREDNADLRERLSKLDAIEANVRVLLDRVASLERYIRGEGLTVPKNGDT